VDSPKVLSRFGFEPKREKSQINIEELLRARHTNRTEWVVVTELRAGVGYGDGREGRIDVAAFNCWPSKGFTRVAYEVKRSRADFRKEMENPLKRKWVEENFHKCYFAVPSGLVKPDEVPEGWGLMVATKNGSKIREVKVAKHRKIEPLPEELALSTIRALAVQLDQVKHRHYFFEGLWLRPEQIDVMVERLVKRERQDLERARLRMEDERKVLKKRRRELEQPLEVLAMASGKWVSMGAEASSILRHGEAPVTVDQVREWIKSVEGQAVKKLLVPLNACELAIGEAKRALERYEEESTGEVKKDS